MTRCKGCGMEIGTTYDKRCEECNKIRWTTVFIIALACFSGLFAILKSNAAMWILGLMLIFYAWLYNDMARNKRIGEVFSRRESSDGRQLIADESDNDYDPPNESTDSHIGWF